LFSFVCPCGAICVASSEDAEAAADGVPESAAISLPKVEVRFQKRVAAARNPHTGRESPINLFWCRRVGSKPGAPTT
jgi:hypothetical protein